jgi:hypothetical protein
MTILILLIITTLTLDSCQIILVTALRNITLTPMNLTVWTKPNYYLILLTSQYGQGGWSYSRIKY